MQNKLIAKKILMEFLLTEPIKNKERIIELEAEITKLEQAYLCSIYNYHEEKPKTSKPWEGPPLC